VRGNAKKKQDVAGSAYFHVSVYIFSTDHGADQGGCDTLLEIDFDGQALNMKFRIWCMRHQLHLISKRHLSRMDVRKFVSKTAVVSNVWRSGKNATLIHAGFVELYGKAVADDVARKLIPRPLRGRWGAIFQVLVYLLRCAPLRVRAVWLLALLRKAQIRTKEAAKLLAKGCVELSVDVGEIEESWIVKESKYIRQSFETLNSDDYILDLQLCHAVLTPLNDMEKFFEKSAKRERILIIDLVCGQSRAIYDLWVGALQQRTHELSFLFDIDIERQPYWVGLAVLCTLEVASDYFRRVVIPCSTNPRMLAWLCYLPAHVQCSQRLEYVIDLVQQCDALDVSGWHSWMPRIGAAKYIGTVFRDELRFCIATDGTLRPRFFNFMLDVLTHMLMDTQETVFL